MSGCYCTGQCHKTGICPNNIVANPNPNAGITMDDSEILRCAEGILDCVDEEHIKRFAKKILERAKQK